MPGIKVIKVSAGLGFGDGSISCAAIEEQPDNKDLAALTDQAIKSADILVPVSLGPDGQMIKDDGCGDGRNIMIKLGAVFSKSRNFAKSLYRPKVFGGGATMATAMRIGLDKAGNQPLESVFRAALVQLNRSGMDFGAHIDNHAAGKNSGCGAIDKSPQIITAIAQYQQPIANAIVSLGINVDGLAEIFQAFSVFANTLQGQPYSGRSVLNAIFENHKIIKELADEHKETRIILNFIEGYTVNQELVRSSTGGRAQVFAVDVWRLEKLAVGLWRNDADKRLGLLSELAYTLATAAVLTAGDLPVYVVKRT